MIVLDSTVVNVALSSIQHDLHFSNAGLAWPVNAYLIELVIACSGASLVLFVAFVVRQARIEKPLLPLHIFRKPNVVRSDVLQVFIVTGLFTFFFLYLAVFTGVPHYDAIRTGLAIFAVAPPQASYLLVIFPAMTLMGVGLGVAFPCIMDFRAVLAAIESFSGYHVAFSICTICMLIGAAISALGLQSKPESQWVESESDAA
ncbi:MAG: hypothetical protein JO322_02695 [Candidatus Eremiobacteraeota bacterium]|nr:hypothetical protein [Candidatus Eremiobacteraeota bacterium]